MVTHVRVELLVKPTSTRNIARLVDPQGWSSSCPQYFVASSKLAEQDGLPVLRDGRPVIEDRAPTLGTSWRGYLYEEVRAAGPVVDWHVQNVLRIELEAQHAGPAPRVRMDFRLHQCLWSRLGASIMRGGIDVDCGFVEAVPDPALRGAFRVTATKSLRFTPRGDWGNVGTSVAVAMNESAPDLVGRWMDQLLVAGFTQPSSSR